MTSYDCLSFYNLVSKLRGRSPTAASTSGWYFLESAEKLFILSQERVYGEAKESEELKIELVEQNPKWKAVQDIAAEIKSQNEQLYDSDLGPGRTLIFAADEQCCVQLRTLLKDGYEPLLRKILEQSCLAGKTLIRNNNEKPSKKRKNDEQDQPTVAKMRKNRAQRTESSEQQFVEPVRTGDKWELLSEALLWNEITDYGLLSPSAIVFHPLYSHSDKAFETARILRNLMPRYVVLYDLDMSVVRQIEVHKATHPAIPLRVYFVMYASSVEEQRYVERIQSQLLFRG